MSNEWTWIPDADPSDVPAPGKELYCTLKTRKGIVSSVEVSRSRLSTTDCDHVTAEVVEDVRLKIVTLTVNTAYQGGEPPRHVRLYVKGSSRSPANAFWACVATDLATLSRAGPCRCGLTAHNAAVLRGERPFETRHERSAPSTVDLVETFRLEILERWSAAQIHQLADDDPEEREQGIRWELTEYGETYAFFVRIPNRKMVHCFVLVGQGAASLLNARTGFIDGIGAVSERLRVSVNCQSNLPSRPSRRVLSELLGEELPPIKAVVVTRSPRLKPTKRLTRSIWVPSRVPRPPDPPPTGEAGTPLPPDQPPEEPPAPPRTLRARRVPTPTDQPLSADAFWDELSDWSMTTWRPWSKWHSVMISMAKSGSGSPLAHFAGIEDAAWNATPRFSATTLGQLVLAAPSLEGAYETVLGKLRRSNIYPEKGSKAAAKGFVDAVVAALEIRWDGGTIESAAPSAALLARLRSVQERWWPAIGFYPNREASESAG